MKVVVAGQGYVGLPLAVRAAERGHSVVGYDVDQHRTKQLAAGESFVQDVTSVQLRAVLDSGAYRATADADALAGGYDIAVITVPTPLRHGAPDLSFVESCARTLGEHLRQGATVVLESTSYPGTTRELLVPILEEASGLRAGDFLAGFSPERITPGSPRFSFAETPKLVSGIDAKSLDAIRGFYDTVFDITVPVSRPEVAEMAKLLENTFRLVNISMINELAMLAHSLGVNVWEAIEAANTKPFGFTRFTPGPGVGGHCLPVDPVFLSWKAEQETGVPFQFVELAAEVNHRMPEYVVQRLMEGLDKRRIPISGARILLLGLTYKINATDLRESPSLRVADLLRDLGAEVRGADPNIPEGDRAELAMLRVDASPEEIAAADAVVLLMDHALFDFEAIQEHAPYVLDCRNRLSGANVEVL
ncbi:nucleotide sugar dehydrogenase [Streptomyces vinaceus]|uniref:nucleotide sugar dehydrogenase n=1 Tax=Streptomyces vinaceus TaxID=1960 RepID=UPI0036C5FB10